MSLGMSTGNKKEDQCTKVKSYSPIMSSIHTDNIRQEISKAYAMPSTLVGRYL